MKREWKPGDVAMVTARNRVVPYRAFFDGKTWREHGADVFCVDSPTTHRPLVVIDPEDREQVEQLAAIYANHGVALGYPRNDEIDADRADSLQAALRILIAPPLPPEPTGLGAVVEDARGDKWVRNWGYWACGMASRDWAGIKAPVRVLHDGMEQS